MISPKISAVLRWIIAIAALVGAIATALNELPQLTLSAAVPAVLLVIGAWIAKSPWDQPKASSVALDDLPREWRDVLAAKKRGR